MSRRRTTPHQPLVAAALVLMLAGCAAVGPDYRPPEDANVPTRWEGRPESAPRDAAALAHWWRQFDDPILEGLVDDALAANLDLATARARLRESRARRDLARAGLGPSLDISGQAGRSETDGAVRKQYSAGFDAGWEPDVFGRARRGVEAAQAEVEASEAGLHDARVSLVAEVARNYLDLRTAEQRLAIAENNLAAQEELYELTGWRRQAGLVSALDESQAQTLLEQTRAGLPALHTSVQESRHRLAILLGRTPGELAARLQATGTIPDAPGAVAVGIPADTLRQRPDVRAAERRLAAQTARVGQAEAARYPDFRLTGSLGLEALTPAGLLNDPVTTNSLLAGLTAPVFDAGRIRSNIDVQDALLEQARLDYEATVLGALEEVENALVALDNSRRRRARLDDAAASARRSLELARQEYASGLADFQSVLDSQRSLLNLQDQLAASRGETGIALIRLYKALGGGWTPGADSNHRGS